MQVRCEMCNSEFDLPRYKGMQHSPMVCSIDCFKDYLDERKNPKILDKLFDTKRKKKKYSNVEIFENFTDGEFRSKIEQDFCTFLTENSIKWDFEKYSFMVRKKMYLPDLFLPDYGIFIELKDKIWESGAYTKFKLFASYIPLILVTRELLSIWRKHAQNKSN